MLKEILDTYMKEENINSLAVLSERLDIPYKKLEKIIKKDKNGSPSLAYKILKDINSEDSVIDQFFKETYGCGNDVYMQMMRDKLESDYKKGLNSNSD